MAALLPLLDEQIAAHEAGHALVAHLMGDLISEIAMYTGEQSAVVRPVSFPPTRATLLAGVTAEMLLGYEINPNPARKDMTNAANLQANADDPTARSLLNDHLPSLDALRGWLVQARQARETIPGPDVHQFLEELGCRFGSRGSKS